MIKKIKKQLGLALIAVLATTSAFAQPADEKALLWKVSGKGITEPSYLFGTNHLVCEQDFFWTGAMDKALKECKGVCLEMDVNDMQKMQQVAMGMMNTDGKMLKDYFSVADYARLETFFKEQAKMDIGIMAPMKPIMVLGVLEKLLVKCGDGKQVSYEMEVLKKAKEEKHSICGLETPEETIDILNSMPTDTAVAAVLQFMKDRATAQQYHDKLLQLYKQQDVPGIYNLVHSAGSLGGSEASFIDNRNRKWVSTISKRVKEGPVFYAVGAGHLGGEQGLVNLLRKAGYTVNSVQ